MQYKFAKKPTGQWTRTKAATSWDMRTTEFSPRCHLIVVIADMIATFLPMKVTDRYQNIQAIKKLFGCEFFLNFEENTCDQHQISICIIIMSVIKKPMHSRVFQIVFCQSVFPSFMVMLFLPCWLFPQLRVGRFQRSPWLQCLITASPK